MSAEHTYRVTAERRAEFPVDMLRVSSSWPATEADAGKIRVNLSNGGVVGLVQSVTLRTRHAPGSYAFEEAGHAWEGFGWHVQEQQETN